MRVVDYKQTRSKEEALDFIRARTTEDSIFEVVIRSKNKSFTNMPDINVCIDGDTAYYLHPSEGRYWNRKIGEFYLTATEAMQLCRYLENYAAGGVTPCWWAQAEKNIRRHGDPLLDLRTEIAVGSNILVRFLE